MVSLDSHLRTLRILWGAFAGSIVVYFALAWLLPNPLQAPDDRHAPWLWALGLLATVNLLTVHPLYRLMLSRGGAAPGGSTEATLHAHRVAFIVAMARVEAVAILGLVLFFIAWRLDWLTAFAAAALAGMLVLYPRRGELDRLLQPTVPAGGAPPK